LSHFKREVRLNYRGSSVGARNLPGLIFNRLVKGGYQRKYRTVISML